jgi:hypothetical protein
VTEQTTTPKVPSQDGPPLADTTDMIQIHRILREAIASAPSLIGSAADEGPERTELVGSYYANVLEFLRVHHDGEDVIIWPALCERAPEHAGEVRRIAGQHDGVTAALEAARARVAEWRQHPGDEAAALAAGAVADLGAALLPHLDEEETFIVPLAAEHIFAPEWGELPGHAMKNFEGDRLWLILGLVQEQFRPEQIEMMEAHMPPPVLGMWRQQGAQAFAGFISELRKNG